MANISSFLAMIKNAVYGKDMRLALHDAIKNVNDDTETRLKLSGGTMSGGITMNDNKITSSASPSSGIDLTNKEYVDGQLMKKVNNTQYANTSEYGLVKLSPKGGILYSEGLTVNTNSAYGTSRTGDGKITIVSATQDQIDSRTNKWNPIVPCNMDYAVAKSFKQASEYDVKYEEDVAYITNKPDSLPIGLYFFTPTQNVYEVRLISNETDLAYVTDIFSVGNTYLIDFDTVESKVLAEINDKSTIEQWVKDNYLPLVGGEMEPNAEIIIPGDSNSGRISKLSYNGLTLIPNDTSKGAYAYGVTYRDPTNKETLGSFGMYGYDRYINYYFVGKWDYPILKVYPTGTLEVNGNLLLNNYNFLAKYADSSTKAIALKLGRIGGYDTKATIDIIGKNLYNFKESGQKYTLTLSFNSRVGGIFPVGGLLYYYGNFDGVTGDITSANKISIQLVQYNNLQNDTYCDIYLLLNEPANWSCFKINVDCLSNTTWTKDLQWITDESDIPQVNNSTSYIVSTKDIAFADSTVSKAIADKNGNDIAGTYMKINDAQKQAYDTGRIWLNGEPIMRQDYCVAIKKGSTTWNDGCIFFDDIISDSKLTASNSMYTGILDWSAFGTYTDGTFDTYDINPIDNAKVEVYTDNDGLVNSVVSFDNNDSVPYEYITIVGHIEYVRNGSNIPKNMVNIIDD